MVSRKLESGKLESMTLKVDSIYIGCILSLVLGLCFPTFGKLESGKLESTTLKVDSIYIGCILSLVLGLCFPTFHFPAFQFQLSESLKVESWKVGKQFSGLSARTSDLDKRIDSNI